MSDTPRLRQIAFASGDIEAAARELHAHLGIEVAYRDPWVGAFGLQNVVMPIGQCDFLEVVTPVEDDTPVGRYLARNGGDGGYMLLVESDDVATLRAEVDALGIRVVQAIEDPAHTGYQLHPKDCDGTILSLDSASEHWLAAGPEWSSMVRTDIVLGVAAVDFAVADPDAVAQRWARITGATLDVATLSFANLDLRLVTAQDGRHGLRSIEVQRGPRCPHPAGHRFRACGVEFVFTDSKGGSRG